MSWAHGESLAFGSEAEAEKRYRQKRRSTRDGCLDEGGMVLLADDCGMALSDASSGYGR